MLAHQELSQSRLASESLQVLEDRTMAPEYAMNSESMVAHQELQAKLPTGGLTEKDFVGYWRDGFGSIWEVCPSVNGDAEVLHARLMSPERKVSFPIQRTSSGGWQGGCYRLDSWC